MVGAPKDPLKIGLVLHMSFDEGSGSRTRDKSKYQNNGTIVGTIEDAISWWKLDEPVDGPVVDAQGNNNGVNHGATINQTGKFGTAYNFDGTNDYVGVPDSSSLHINIGTWCFWINYTDLATMGVLARWTLANGYSYSIGVDQYGRIRFLTTSDGTAGTVDILVSAGFLNLGAYNFIVCTYDGTTKRIYINNQLDTHTSIISGVWGGTSDLTIGSEANAFYFKGYVDEVRVYNRALNQAEINMLYNVNQFGWTPNGKFGEALDFDGTDDYIEVSSSDSLNLQNNGSIVAWVYARTTGGAGGFGRICSFGSNNAWEILLFNGKLTTYNFNDGIVISNFDLPLNGWHFVCLTVSPTQIIFYLDGVPDTPVALTSYVGTSGLNLHIGVEGEGGTAFFDGLIDEFRIYNRALSAEEIKTLYRKVVK